MTINLLFFFFLFIILNKIAHSKGLIKVVLLVLVQNFAARGLALQTIKLISLFCIIHRKKNIKQKNSFHLNIKCLVFPFSFVTISSS
jgi:hypothetical protein